MRWVASWGLVLGLGLGSMSVVAVEVAVKVEVEVEVEMAGAETRCVALVASMPSLGVVVGSPVMPAAGGAVDRGCRHPAGLAVQYHHPPPLGMGQPGGDWAAVASPLRPL